MGSAASSESESRDAVVPRPQTSEPVYKPDNNVNRLVKTMTLQSKRKKYPTCSESLEGEEDVADRQARYQESIYILKQLYKRMDPAVMKTLGDAKGEVKLSFKYNEKKNLLLVKIVNARDLSAKDLRGKTSDPYVKLELLPDTLNEGFKTTRYAKQTLKPVYNEIFTFNLKKVDIADSMCRVQVMSHDPLGKDDFMGERIISLSDCVDLNKVTTSWFELQPETDLDITGSLEVSLAFRLPDTLTVMVHGAYDLICRDSNRLPSPFVKVILPGIPKVATTQIQRKTLCPVWKEKFEYTITREGLPEKYLVLHVLDKAMVGDTEEMGQVYIDLKKLDINNGYDGQIPLADLKNSDRVRTHCSQSATAQEFKEAMYAHSIYRYPYLVFGKQKSGNKVVSVRSRKAGSTAKLRLIDGLPM